MTSEHTGRKILLPQEAPEGFLEKVAQESGMSMEKLHSMYTNCAQVEQLNCTGHLKPIPTDVLPKVFCWLQVPSSVPSASDHSALLT